MEHASSIGVALDNYLSLNDADNFLHFRYPFPNTDAADAAQNFMVTMAMIYHAVVDYCISKNDTLEDLSQIVYDFYSGRIPELPPPLPCVDLGIVADIE